MGLGVMAFGHTAATCMQQVHNQGVTTPSDRSYMMASSQCHALTDPESGQAQQCHLNTRIQQQILAGYMSA